MLVLLVTIKISLYTRQRTIHLNNLAPTPYRTPPSLIISRYSFTTAFTPAPSFLLHHKNIRQSRHLTTAPKILEQKKKEKKKEKKRKKKEQNIPYHSTRHLSVTMVFATSAKIYVYRISIAYAKRSDRYRNTYTCL